MTPPESDSHPLERIAYALERIARALEVHVRPTPPTDDAPAAPPPAPPVVTPQTLLDFLASRGVRPRDDPPQMASSQDQGVPDLDDLAALIGDRWANTRTLVEAVKQRLGSGEPFVLNLRGQPPALISDACAVAGRAHGLSLLEEYRYRRSPAFRLEARPSRVPLSQRFWAGGWLERWARQSALRVAAQLRPDAPCAWVANLPVLLPNGEASEIDLLIAVGAVVVWVECKTGDYQEHLDKYSRLRRVLNLPSERAIVVLADPHAPHRALSALYGLTVCGLEDFAARATLALAENEKSPPRVDAGNGKVLDRAG